jgi:hypothetical protein
MKSFGFGAVAQEFEIVGAIFDSGTGGQAQSDECAYMVVGVGGA